MSPPSAPPAEAQCGAQAEAIDYFGGSHAVPGGGGTYVREPSSIQNPWAQLAGAFPTGVAMPPLDTPLRSASGPASEGIINREEDPAAMARNASLYAANKRMSLPTNLSFPRGALAGGGVRRNTVVTPSTMADANKFEPVMPSAMATMLRGGNTAVVDIRPATAFAQRHIRGSINLCAPSTLLRRREVSLESLGRSMLSDAERQVLEDWRLANVTTIVAVSYTHLTLPTKRIV